MEAGRPMEDEPTDKIFDFLNNEQIADTEKRSALIRYIQERAELYRNSMYRPEDIAYNLAGLMATEYFKKLNEDDPIEDVLTRAGDLELPQPHQTEDWPTLLQLIDNLR